jgi:predicted sulfurtransferase
LRSTSYTRSRGIVESKEKEKKTKKVWTGSSNVLVERLYVNISLKNDESFGGTNFWSLISDHCIDYCWSYFVKIKDQLKTKVVELVEELKVKGRLVKYGRLNDIFQ